MYAPNPYFIAEFCLIFQKSPPMYLIGTCCVDGPLTNDPILIVKKLKTNFLLLTFFMSDKVRKGKNANT